MTERSVLQVEESRALLRAILSRRDFVQAGLTAGVGVLGMSACASSAPTTTPPPPAPPPPPPTGTIPSGFQAVTGSVSLPAGSQLKVSDLSVDVLTQTVPVSASSAFTIGITADGPALALLLDKNGDGVLMSMFDSGSASHTLSSHTTAVALLYYGTGAFLLPAAAMSQVLALLDGDPAVAGLESAVAAAVAADPHALANNAPALGPAITQALQTIVGSSLRKPPAAASRVAIRSASGVPTLMLLNSAAEQNGVVVSLDTVATTVLVSNAKRRPCKAYVYEVTTQTGTTVSDVSPATLIQGPLDIDSTQSLGVFNGLKALAYGLNGEAPWTPVNLAPIPLTLAPATADKTIFQVIVLSSSPKYPSGNTFEPAFFRDPHFVNEIAKWRADTRALYAISVVGDLILPILCMVAGFGAISASRQTVIQEVTNSQFLGSAVFADILNTLQFGSMGTLESGLAAVVQNSVNSGVTGNLQTQWLPKVQAVVDSARAKAIAVQSAPTIGSRMASGAKMFSKVFEPFFLAGFVLDGIDFGKVVHDFGESDLGATWEVDLYRQKLGLIPQDPRVSGGDPVHFRVSQPANLPPGTYQYDWTQTSPFAKLSALGESNIGTSITTSQLSVDLLTTGSDVTPINVLVVGYDTSKTPRQEIGRAGTTVTFLQRAEIIPANAAVDVGEQRLFSVNVEGNLPSGVRYQWTVNGTGGTVGGTSTVITTVPQVNYTGVTAGATDVLHVDVIDLGNNLIAKADASIRIAQASSIQFDVRGTWANLTAPANGSYTFTDFAGGRTAGTASLDALVSDFDQTPTADGVTLVLVVPTGAGISTGQTFSKVVQGQPAAGQFVLSLSVNLSDPENSIVTAPGNSGSLTLTSVTQLASGTYLAQYTFSISNGTGGTIAGSGVGRWK